MGTKIGIVTIILIALTIINFLGARFIEKDLSNFDYSQCYEEISNTYSNSEVQLLSINVNYEICSEKRSSLNSKVDEANEYTFIIFLLTIISWKIDNLKKQ